VIGVEPEIYKNLDLFGGSEDALKSAVQQQVEYYFSVENLLRDMYLRSLLDDEFYVPVYEIIMFNRMQYLTNDAEFILGALVNSSVVEVSEDRIRRREHPEHFPRIEPVLPQASAFGDNAWATRPVTYDFSAPAFVPSFLASSQSQSAAETEPAPASAQQTTSSALALDPPHQDTAPIHKSDSDEWVTKTPTKPKTKSGKSAPPQPAVS
jgi:hypothetical protein